MEGRERPQGAKTNAVVGQVVLRDTHIQARGRVLNYGVMSSLD